MDDPVDSSWFEGDVLLEAIPIAICVTDINGDIVRFNRRASEVWGSAVPPKPGDRARMLGGPRPLFWPDGRLLAPHERPSPEAVLSGRSYRDIEMQIERADGSQLWVAVDIEPLRDRSGNIVGCLNCLRKIAERPDGTRVPFLAFAPLNADDMAEAANEREQAERQRKILINELNHRVKNTLASVQALASQAFQKDSATEVYQRFESRLIALARAHDTLAVQNWDGAAVRDIVRRVCGHINKVVSNGDDVRVSSRVALPLAMLLHELYLNATCFGALSDGVGHVDVSWHRVRGKLYLLWQEKNGPIVQPPNYRGFGTRLIEHGIGRELSADIKWDFHRSGVACSIHTVLT